MAHKSYIKIVELDDKLRDCGYEVGEIVEVRHGILYGGISIKNKSFGRTDNTWVEYIHPEPHLFQVFTDGEEEEPSCL